MIYFPHAKINLGLQVIEKRKDGFHNIVSGLYPIGWCDILEIIEKPQLSFRATGLDIPGDEEHNLCLKAYRRLKQQFDIPPVYIHLHKVVPIGAGLGGGSADAAFTLKGLNQIFSLGIPQTQLKKIAAELGSDCPFFIDGHPSLATGVGDQLDEIEVSVPGEYLVVITPPVQVNTGLAYSMLTPKKPDINLKRALTKPGDGWSGSIKNDFEGPIFDSHPVIQKAKEILLDQGANYASMSGSGSSVFGFFDEDPGEVEGWFGPEYMVFRQAIGFKTHY